MGLECVGTCFSRVYFVLRTNIAFDERIHNKPVLLCFLLFARFIPVSLNPISSIPISSTLFAPISQTVISPDMYNILRETERNDNSSLHGKLLFFDVKGED